MTRPAPERLLTARAFPEHPDLGAAERLQRFLHRYWQRQALFMPAALAGLGDLLDGDELAGLACEPDADARIVRREDDGFVQETGPFEAERFATIGDANWTLLVNAVDLELPGFDPLLAMLRFVPDWRVDDVMVSFAAPGGSVGPHVDHYDVFLVQLEGRRRWELGGDCHGDRLPRRSTDGLDLISHFEPEQVIHCEPGDVLYVPPGMVHHGVAETPGLTCSLGLRAPSERDLLGAWAAALAAEASGTPMDLDPPLPAEPGRLAAATIDRAHRALRAALTERLQGGDRHGFAHWLGRMLTTPGRVTSPEPPSAITPGELERILGDGAMLERAPGARLLWYEDDVGRVLFTGGEAFAADDVSADQLDRLTEPVPLDAATLARPAVCRLATELYNAGWLVPSATGEEDPA